MAVRVRKIARELDRSSEDLLLLLKELGHTRFRSEDDMISDEVAEQLRKAARSKTPRALLSLPKRALPNTTAGAQPATHTSTADDLMSALVPGVVRADQQRLRARTTPERDPRAPANKTPVNGAASQTHPEIVRADPEPESPAMLEWARLTAERNAIDVRAAELDARAAALDARAAALDIRERTSDARVAPVLPHEDDVSVLTLMEERGLRGLDEAERALAALAARHVLGAFLGSLIPKDRAAFARMLSERLVLVGGPIPEGLAAPAITVSSERSDLPGSDRFLKMVNRIGERLLLDGLRRVLLMGVPPRWHTLLRESIDRRVELVFRAAIRDDELGRVDLVVGWNTEPPTDSEPRKHPLAARRSLFIAAPTMGEFLERWMSSLTIEASDRS